MSEATWSQVRLGDVATVCVGGTPSTYVPEYWGGEIPWMNSGDLSHKLVTNLEPRITESGLRASSAALVDPPTVAVGLVGQGKTRGTAALVLQRLSCSQSVALITGHHCQLDARYLFHNLDWRYEELRSFSAGGSGRGVLSKLLLEAFLIPMPSLDEQRLIAEILDLLDDQLGVTERTITKKRSVEAGLICDVWRKVESSRNRRNLPLDELASVDAGLTLGEEPSGPSSIALPYLRVANVQDGYIDTNEMKTVRVLRSQVERYAAKRSDVLLTEGGDFDKLGRGALWDGRIDPCLHQNHVFRVRCKTDMLLPDFLGLYTGAPAGRRYFQSVAKQTTNLASINSRQLKAMPVPVPSIEEQQRLLQPVRASREEIAHERVKHEKLRLVKQGLVDDLLSGRVRVTRSGELTG